MTRTLRTADATSGGSTPTQQTDVERSMIAFLRRWYTYGGGRAEDIMVEFGLTPSEFFGRVRALLEGGAPTGDRATTDAMVAVCRKRLWLGQ